MTTEQAKRFKYWQYRTIIATMIGYALFYFVRKNFSFAIPGLAAEYGITNTSFGLIMTVVGLIYGLSRFMNGLIADRMNGRWHMSLGLLLCVLTSGRDISSRRTDVFPLFYPKSFILPPAGITCGSGHTCPRGHPAQPPDNRIRSACRAADTRPRPTR